MNRRNLAQVVAGTAVAHGLVSVMGCQAQNAAPEAAKGHDGHEGHIDSVSAASSPTTQAHKDVAKAAAECELVGTACLEHCIRLLSAGNTSMGDCATAVQQMLAVCGAMKDLAAMGSSFAKKMAPLCQDACGACEEACRKHAHHHEECNACAEACAATVKALGAFA